LEGKFRPGHFQGVCQVMNRLLDIVQPDNLYMGQKDYQQCMIVERLLKIMQAGVALNTCGTLREPDGLAMSSRNARLNTTERKNAVAIFKVLNCFRQKLQTGNLKDLLENGKSLLVQHGFKPDYIEIRDAKTLESLSFWDGKQQLVALVAASMNQVRLIDNMIVTV
ncbi:MAG: pantoate--beta-alanine ligase, partial [Chitinophagaceae bacterium]